jgi:outer membrane protein OmpA-like peptidoglycan-associated protein
MKTLLLFAALAATAPFAADAADRGFYLGAGLGANWTRDTDVTGTGTNVSADFDAGWAGALSAGWAYGNGVRSEIEFGYRSNDVDSLSGAAAGTGDASSWRGMVNLYYDFKTETPFTPYLGVGIGAARVSLDANPVGASRLDDSDTAFAYQGIAGAAYRLNENAQIFADYRYFATTSLDFTTAAGTAVDADYDNHTLMVGLRFGFAPPKPAPKEEPKPAVQPVAPPPPPPPPAARVVPRNYLVFFDWDKADLKPEALRTIAIAAADAKTGNIARIRATGHADRSGPEAYNMRLSMRRAVAVKNELVRLGIAEKDIVLVAKGETEPLVPTPDGVREPQNRRVEIVFP